MLSFNVGVEIGQVMLFLLMLLVLRLLTSRISQTTVTAGASVVVLMMGLVWVAERAFHLDLLPFGG